MGSIKKKYTDTQCLKKTRTLNQIFFRVYKNVTNLFNISFLCFRTYFGPLTKRQIKVILSESLSFLKYLTNVFTMSNWNKSEREFKRVNTLSVEGWGLGGDASVVDLCPQVLPYGLQLSTLH